jgi:hypothetical protein
MRVFNKQIATGVSLNANSNSPYVPLRSIYTYAIAALVTGTPTGIIKLQASNDPETNDTQTNTTSNLPPAVGPVNWVDIANSTFTLTTSGETMWNVNAAGYNYVRVAYSDSSGGASTAVMDIIFNGKGI